MKHIIYNVSCPYGKHDPLPYAVTVHESKNFGGTTVEIWCPFCNQFVQAEVDAQPVDNTEAARLFGFT
jgi:hypothetical protein